MDTQHLAENRTVTDRDATSTMTPFWRPRMVSVLDLISNRNRSPDFLGTRADYIQDRIRALSLAFAVVVLLWIALDYAVIRDLKTWAVMAALRILCAALYVGLACLGSRPHDLDRARVKLGLLMALPCLFYIASRLVLDGHVPVGVLTVYTFFPFVIVAQLGVFSLPLLEGVALALPAFVTLFAAEYYSSALSSIDVLGNLALLTLLTCLALWASMSELHMLLRLYRQATTDPLTGLFNRGALVERMQVEVDRAQEEKQDLCVLLFDLDQFKRINDQHGHLAGDAVLHEFAGILNSAARRADLLGRYGGEEFIAVLPHTRIALAEQLAEQVRDTFANREFADAAGQSFNCTTSVGVAQRKPHESTQALLRRADTSLYQAKQAGRDRVILAA